MVSVIVKNNETFENALRRFKKKWLKARTLREVRSRTHYLKPSEARKLASRSKRKRPVIRTSY